MKIIEIGTGYTPIPSKIGAATEIVIENLIKGFNQLGVTNELIDIGFTQKDKSQYDEELNTIVHVLKLPKYFSLVNEKSLLYYIKRIYYSIKVGLFLRKSLKNYKGDVVLHFHNQFNFYFAYQIIKKLLKKKGISIIYTIHSPGWSLFNKIPFGLKLEKFAIKKATYIISLTEIIKMKIVALNPGIDEKKIIVIPNGVSLQTYAPIETIKKENIILNVGSICERKNQLETLRTLKNFLIENSFEFKFAGKIIDTKYYKKITEYIELNGLTNYVVYLGEIQPGIQLNSLYNSSMFYVSNSKQEAFSLVVLESMAAGLPVLLSNTFDKFIDSKDSLREVIKILPDHQIVLELSNLLKDNRVYNLYRNSQINFIQSQYDWNIIAKKVNNINTKN